MPSNYGFSILQQGIEDIVKTRQEAQKAEADAIGNRKLYEQAVKAGMLDLDQQIEYNKGNAPTKDRILAGAMRSWQAQREAEQDKMRRDAFALDQGRFQMEQARAKYTPSPEDIAALPSNYRYVKKAPGQFEVVQVPKTVTQEQIDEANRKAQAIVPGSGFVLPPGPGEAKFLTPPTPEPPTIYVPGAGKVGVSTELGQAQVKEMNPAEQIFKTWGAKPEDFMPDNVTVGALRPANLGGQFESEGSYAKAKSHVLLKNTGTIMPTGDYTKYLRQLSAAGDINEPVKHPVTGQWITPQQKAQANPRVLKYNDPASTAIMQSYLLKYGDPNAARAAAIRDGLVWDPETTP
jgi:hypothetical protein